MTDAQVSKADFDRLQSVLKPGALGASEYTSWSKETQDTLIDRANQIAYLEQLVSRRTPYAQEVLMANPIMEASPPPTHARYGRVEISPNLQNFTLPTADVREDVRPDAPTRLADPMFDLLQRYRIPPSFFAEA